LADLSVRPTPPPLEGRQRANYPRALARQGKERDPLGRVTRTTSGNVVRPQN
jgi:hypothetical protein